MVGWSCIQEFTVPNDFKPQLEANAEPTPEVGSRQPDGQEQLEKLRGSVLSYEKPLEPGCGGSG